MKYKAKLASNTECDLDYLDAQAGLSLKAIQKCVRVVNYKKNPHILVGLKFCCFKPNKILLAINFIILQFLNCITYQLCIYNTWMKYLLWI